jgi:hypothetical protein
VDLATGKAAAGAAATATSRSSFSFNKDGSKKTEAPKPVLVRRAGGERERKRGGGEEKEGVAGLGGLRAGSRGRP